MSYTIGQLRKNQVSNFLTPISNDITTNKIKSTYFDNTIFEDVAMTPASAMTEGKNYFIRFSIKKMGASAYDGDNLQNITIRLYKELLEYTDDDVQFIETLPRISATAEDEEWVTFEKVFTPDDTYEYFGFILSRTNYDYKYTTNPRKITVRIDAFGSVDNILPTTVNSYIKIGVQSRPGSLLCVNGEQIRIGRSGTYEVNNGVPVTFFGFAGTNEEIGQFILDYAYNV